MSRRPLTDREEQVLDLLLERGASNAEIAADLVLQESTVDHLLWRIRRRYGVHTTRQLVAMGWRERHGAVVARLADCQRTLERIDQRRRFGVEERT